MSIVVTGTDTGVGKTVTSAVILERYGRKLKLGYWKPVATDAVEGRDTSFIRAMCAGRADVLEETYLFDPPLSPHLAAARSGVEIDPDRILAALVGHGMAEAKRSLVVEGIGGVLVPLTRRGYLFADLLGDLHLPCLIVARSTLGTINHTLLTLEALRSRRIEVAGVVLVGPRSPGNRAAIEAFGKVEVISEIPWLRSVSRPAVVRQGRRFDPERKLEKYLE
jgi:dethiobiotin synthase